MCAAARLFWLPTTTFTTLAAPWLAVPLDPSQAGLVSVAAQPLVVPLAPASAAPCYNHMTRSSVDMPTSQPPPSVPPALSQATNNTAGDRPNCDAQMLTECVVPVAPTKPVSARRDIFPSGPRRPVDSCGCGRGCLPFQPSPPATTVQNVVGRCWLQVLSQPPTQRPQAGPRPRAASLPQMLRVGPRSRAAAPSAAGAGSTVPTTAAPSPPTCCPHHPGKGSTLDNVRRSPILANPASMRLCLDIVLPRALLPRPAPRAKNHAAARSSGRRPRDPHFP